MTVRNLEWYNLNGQRSYPLDELATQLDDEGNFLPHDLLVDAHLRFPDEYGKSLFLSSLTNTARLTTATILASRTAAAQLQQERILFPGGAPPPEITGVYVGDIADVGEFRYPPYEVVPIDDPGLYVEHGDGGSFFTYIGSIPPDLLNRTFTLRVWCALRTSTPEFTGGFIGCTAGYVPEAEATDIYEDFANVVPSLTEEFQWFFFDLAGVEFTSVTGSMFANIIHTSSAPTVHLASSIFELIPTDEADDFVPIAAISLPKPFDIYRAYPVQPLISGVGGWLVFGDGVAEAYQGRFSVAAQSRFSPRAARNYRPLPVTSVRKVNVAQRLQGDVLLRAGTDLALTRETVTIDGDAKDALVLRAQNSLNRNIFDLYRGPCGVRPESHTCAREPLESINSVAPDCDGNLEIEFRGVTAGELTDGGGLTLAHALGLADACTQKDRLPDADGNLPNTYQDMCDSLSSEISLESSVDSEGEVPPEDSVSEEDEGECLGIPYFDQFSSPTLETHWQIKSGAFELETASSISSEEPLDEPEVTALISTDTARRNVAVWQDCGYDVQPGQVCRTRLSLQAGAMRNAGIVVDYRTPLGLPDRYLYAAVDQLNNGLLLYLFNGYQFVKLGEAGPLGIKLGDWYDLEVRVVSGANLGLELDLQGVTDPLIAASMTVNTQHLVGGGHFGLGSWQGYAHFGYFEIGTF